MRIKVPLQGLIPDEPLPAETALELNALVHLGDRENIESNKMKLMSKSFMIWINWKLGKAILMKYSSP